MFHCKKLSLEYKVEQDSSRRFFVKPFLPTSIVALHLIQSGMHQATLAISGSQTRASKSLSIIPHNQNHYCQMCAMKTDNAYQCSRRILVVLSYHNIESAHKFRSKWPRKFVQWFFYLEQNREFIPNLSMWTGGSICVCACAAGFQPA